MKLFASVVMFLILACPSQASWYWPFRSETVFGSSEPRLSELMEKASTMIDEAADLADEGKTEESVEKYRAVLEELDRIERENPERAKTPEFATVRNKRAYVNAKIDSMLMNQVKTNAKVVAVSDTRELERRLAEERWGKSVDELREITGVDKNAEEKEAALASVAPAVKKSLGLCGALSSNDAHVVVTCYAGASKYCEFEAFDRAIRLLDFAGGRLDEMAPTTNVTVRSRLKGGLREVKNTLAGLALSSATNRVEFREGLKRTVARVDEISKKTDRVVRSPKPVRTTSGQDQTVEETSVAAEPKPAEKPVESKPAAAEPKKASVPDRAPRTKREQAMADIARGDYAAAELVIREMLQAKPNGAVALNLKAAMEMKQGKLDEAEATLDQAIMNNGRNYFAYYNMARLMLQKNADDKDRARKYYETGRTYGGPKDAELEAALK